jgi:hypothetical protein
MWTSRPFVGVDILVSNKVRATPPFALGLASIATSIISAVVASTRT